MDDPNGARGEPAVERFVARGARLQPASFDEEARTIEVVWTTGAVVRRRDWDGEFDELLEVTPEAVRLDRLNGGASVLNSHWAYDARDVVGAVVPGSVRLNDGVGTARIQLSGARDAAAIVERVREGTLRHVSVGYMVHRFDEEKRKGEVPLVRVTDWEPMEVSLVAIPADAGAAVRGGFARAAYRGAATSAAQQSTEVQMDETEGRGAPAAVETGTEPAPAASPVNADQVRDEATRAERRRVSEIQKATRVARLPETFAADLIERGVALDEARGAIIDEMARRAPQIDGAVRASVGRSSEDPVVQRRAMSTALQHRFQVRGVQLDEHARTFRGLSLLDLAAECLEAGGVSTRRMPREELARRAMEGVSDFASLLADVAHNVLLDGYMTAPGIYREIARRRDFSDFKAHRHTLATAFPQLQAMQDDQTEIKFGQLPDSGETLALVTYARRIGLTRRALINDDLDAFGDMSRLIGRTAANTENAAVVGLLQSNPTMADGNALFHSASHANYTSSGAVISVASLGAGRAMLRKQTNQNGDKLNLAPRFVVTSPDHETLAQQHTLAVVPDAVGPVANVFSGSLLALSDANLVGNPWYLLADPREAAVLSYGYLNGQETPTITQHADSGYDGLVWKVVHDFGAGVVDYRGGYKNAGASS